MFSAKTPKEKLAQRMFFFWYKPEERRAIESELRRIGRTDLIAKLYDKPLRGGKPAKGRHPDTRFDDKAIGSTYDNPGVGRGAKGTKGKRGAERNDFHGSRNEGRGNRNESRGNRNESRGNYRNPDRFAPKGYGNVGCYDEEKYLNDGRPLGSSGKQKGGKQPTFKQANAKQQGGKPANANIRDAVAAARAELKAAKDQGSGFFKGKKKKSFNPNFDNNNHKRKR